MFQPETTDQDDLHSGRSPWSSGVEQLPRASLNENQRCDVVVVGAGITGALAAEHLTRRGLAVCIVDREQPGFGSTAASTAMVLWELDQPLRKLSIGKGFEPAANVLRQCVAAVDGLLHLVGDGGIDCCARVAPSLYLAAGDVGVRELQEEHMLRSRAGLPGHFLDHRALLSRYGIAREAALLSPGSADLDPVRLTRGLLAIAVHRGARLIDGYVSDYDSSAKEAAVELDNGRVISAPWVVLATGYIMPEFVRSDLHRLASSWAICTPPQAEAALWPEHALIWEASEDYHYLRTTPDRRIIIGGEDESDVVEPEQRDRLIAAKSDMLLAELRRLRPQVAPVADYAWTGAFGQTVDGLPLIGRIPQRPRMLAAYGYGGNGITFSYLASRVIADIMDGNEQPWFDELSFARDA